MENSRRASLLQVLFITCAVLAAGITAYTSYRYIITALREASAVENANKKSLRQTMTVVDDTLRVLMKVTAQLADQAGGVIGNEAAYKTLCTDMQKALEENSGIDSISASYAPYAFDPAERLHSVQYARGKSGVARTTLETWYDYTNTAWYTAAKTTRPQWLDPLYDASLRKAVTTYVVPIFKYDRENHTKEFIGVFAIDIGVDYLDTLVESTLLQKNSYLILVTRSGMILAHPTDEYAQQGKTLFDLASTPGNKAFISLGNKIARVSDGSMTFTIQNALYKRCKAIFSTIPHMNWVLIIVGPEKADVIPTMEIRHLLIHLMLALIALCTGIAALAFGLYHGTPRALWLTASACALFILTGICTIWAFGIISVEDHLYHTNIVDSEIALNQFLGLQKKTNPVFYKHDTRFIPTGLYLYNVTLETTNPNMTVNGHIWQKFDVTRDADLVKELVVFNAMEQSFDKVYDTIEGNTQIIGWRFSAKIKGNFDYTRYPFDQQNLVFALGHKDYVKNVILVPDFAAFTGMRSAHAEIDPSTNTTPWRISSTYSFYELTHFDTNFGIKDYTHQTDFPTLCFNISVRRDFLYPFLASVLPIAIILLVAFSILIIIGLSKQNTDLASLELSLCSGLLFATILSHQTFQRSVEASQLTYFEYFYFWVYTLIILITINGLLYSLNRGGFFINYNQNIIARLIFWPVTMGMFLVTTLLFFY
jgi:hypothetical protein